MNCTQRYLLKEHQQSQCLSTVNGRPTSPRLDLIARRPHSGSDLLLAVFAQVVLVHHGDRRLVRAAREEMRVPETSREIELAEALRGIVRNNMATITGNPHVSAVVVEGLNLFVVHLRTARLTLRALMSNSRAIAITFLDVDRDSNADHDTDAQAQHEAAENT